LTPGRLADELRCEQDHVQAAKNAQRALEGQGPILQSSTYGQIFNLRIYDKISLEKLQTRFFAHLVCLHGTKSNQV
jgi:hypothetical protein